ncbi:MAG: hypothetical protein GYB68_01725 [Chloroflexi bacterium]|nr:hypothetical protein [Chloroflexota bacterium]
MAIRVSWANAERDILLWTIEGTWNWEDIQLADATAELLYKRAEQTVFSIWDFSKADDVPRDVVLYLPQLSQMLRDYPQTASPKVAVVPAARPLLLRLIRMLGTRSGGVEVVTVLGDAQDLIKRARVALPA